MPSPQTTARSCIQKYTHRQVLPKERGKVLHQVVAARRRTQSVEALTEEAVLNDLRPHIAASMAVSGFWLDG